MAFQAAKRKCVGLSVGVLREETAFGAPSRARTVHRIQVHPRALRDPALSHSDFEPLFPGNL